MSLVELNWVGRATGLDRLATTLMRCYSHTGTDVARFRTTVEQDARLGPDDWLLATRGGEDVGIAASYAFDAHVRGATVPCQGVGNVGTIKTARRKTAGGRAAGIGTAVMRGLLDRARDRGHVLSALMPFRASYYEHFGYGVAERRAAWTVPLSVLRTTTQSGVRFYDPATDRPAVEDLARRVARGGQLDFDRPPGVWDWTLSPDRQSFAVVGQLTAGAPLESFMLLGHEHTDGRDVLVIPGPRASGLYYATVDALERLLSFVASLRDQYHAVTLHLPVDLPLNLLLREAQLPHRPVNHAHAAARPYTRMQVRVLDHKRLLEAVAWPPHARGSAVVAVQESEGETARFRVDVADARASVTPSAAVPDLATSDGTWAQIAVGDLRASTAWRLGLVAVERPDVLAVLDGLAHGPTPFSHEYF